MRELTNKVAVVTGGSGGIGQAIGQAMLAEGMKVVLADITEDVLSQTAKEFANPNLIGIPVDVSDYESLCSLREKTIEHFGAVHVIVNNAAVGAGAKGSVWEHHLNDWRWSLDVNVMGVINGMNAFIPTLVAQDEGHVVNTSSGNGAYFPMPSSGWAATIFKLNPLTPLVLTTRDWLTGISPEYLSYFIIVNVLIVGLLLAVWMIYRVAMPILIERMSA